MIHSFLKFIRDHHLFEPKDKILVAVSGGIDSVVLASLYSESDFSFAIAHCNFSLRDAESDTDEDFVRQLAKECAIPFFVKRFDTESYAKKKHISTQMAARALRYAWFRQLLVEEGFHYLATAHHQNDVAETVLFNLTKGTGIAGLHGIQAKKGQIIRPLLFANKQMIEEYASDKQLIWREDTSNSSDRYHRNLIRRQVVPLLKTINPRFEEKIMETVEKVNAVERIFYKKLQEVKEKIWCEKIDDIYLDIKEILKEKEQVAVLFFLINPFGFNYAQAKKVLISAGNSGKYFDSATHRLNVDREYFIISPKKEENFKTVDIHKNTRSLQHVFFKMILAIQNMKGYSIPANKNKAALDYDKLQFPLSVRTWKPGDWFYPLGMSHKKKLSDFMIDEKIPLNLKDRIFLLTSGDAIVWVMGHRIDNRFKITQDTQKIYEVCIEE